MGCHKKGTEPATELCDESMDRNGAETGWLQINVESDSTEAVLSVEMVFAAEGVCGSCSSLSGRGSKSLCNYQKPRLILIWHLPCPMESELELPHNTNKTLLKLRMIFFTRKKK